MSQTDPVWCSFSITIQPKPYHSIVTGFNIPVTPFEGETLQQTMQRGQDMLLEQVNVALKKQIEDFFAGGK